MSESKTVLVTGATGLVGRPLCEALVDRGHILRRLSRSEDADYTWDVEKGAMDAAAMEGVDAVIHLAGETVAQTWNQGAKERILRSRVDSTRLLAEEMLKQEKPPAFISASGISYYGTERAEPVDETVDSGDGFLAEVTRQWEGAAQPLVEAGVRVAFLRTGIVLTKEGGALAKMFTPFKMGVGGRIGNGTQQMSWLSLPDMVNVYVFALENDSVSGPINAVAPQPVSNKVFSKTLGFVIGRPTIFPLPKAVVKLFFGEMGEETVLSNLAVLPKRLQELGFEWQQPDLEDALRRTIYDL
ncbi:MAG: TIGR01777 family oxidoreductase [Opitutaceae bacterium]